jgi:uncharacterized protein (DUF2147 family)
MEYPMSYKRQIAALAIAVACTAASAASAVTPSWPAKIVGTWKGLSNQTSVILKITGQTGSGRCQDITGTLQNVRGGTDTIYGYYCPYSGNIEFRRFSSAYNPAYQAYNGSLNQANAGAPHLLIAGVFSQYILAYGPLGQYSFSLTN